jgi:hypothetical protein
LFGDAVKYAQRLRRSRSARRGRNMVLGMCHANCNASTAQASASPATLSRLHCRQSVVCSWAYCAATACTKTPGSYASIRRQIAVVSSGVW